MHPVLVLTTRVLDESDLLWGYPPLSGGAYQCRSEHDDYTCSHNEDAMSGDDGMGSSTRVPVAKHAWVHVVRGFK
jgi:hypothetical protein